MNIPILRHGHWLGLLISLVVFGQAVALRAEARTEVIVVADYTPEGKDFTPPTLENPALYILTSAGSKELGSVYANDPVPPASAVEPQVRDVLAKQNYRPATRARPDASLLIVYSWGIMQPADFDVSFGSPPITVNQGDMLALIGGEKLDLSPYNFERSSYYSETTSGRYFLLIGAYDYAAFKRGEKRMLWRVRLSVPRRRTNLTEAIPALLAAGGPFLGQNHSKPLLISTRLRGGDVHTGTPTVIEYLEK